MAKPLIYSRQTFPFLSAALLIVACSGCSTVACQAIPAARLPSWMLPEARANQEPINFIRLRQDPPADYRLGPRDMLGIYVEGILPRPRYDDAGRPIFDPPPTHFPQEADTPPAIGFPIPVRDDGTITLPDIAPIKVSDLTVIEAELLIRKTYLDAGILPDKANHPIIVTLMRKRTYQVLVIREDTQTQQSASAEARALLRGPVKKGEAYALDLKAYENDVLHALTETGGLPGLDAKNVITILRGSFTDAQGRDALLRTMESDGEYQGPEPYARDNTNVMRIPLRARPGRPIQRITPDDIILATGDVIFIESRDREVFYSGGLLRGEEHLLPRDYDLDVVAAISVAGGAVASAAGSGTHGPGFGSGGLGNLIPPSQVIIIRKLPNGSTMPLKVSLNTALTNPRENIYIQPGDLVLLEYTPCELVGNIVLGSVSFQYFLNKIQ